jgi:hypothetical protein
MHAHLRRRMSPNLAGEPPAVVMLCPLGLRSNSSQWTRLPLPVESTEPLCTPSYSSHVEGWVPRMSLAMVKPLLFSQRVKQENWLEDNQLGESGAVSEILDYAWRADTRCWSGRLSSGQAGFAWTRKHPAALGITADFCAVATSDDFFDMMAEMGSPWSPACITLGEESREACAVSAGMQPCKGCENGRSPGEAVETTNHGR